MLYNLENLITPPIFYIKMTYKGKKYIPFKRIRKKSFKLLENDGKCSKIEEDLTPEEEEALIETMLYEYEEEKIK